MKKLVLAFCLVPLLQFGQSLHQFVNPMIGTGGHGHTFPGATAPFGMVQLSPDTRVDGSWDGCSGYHHSDSVIYGFSHTHLNGTGCSDFGDIMLMPTMGEPNLDPKGYSSAFSHANEQTAAGYYAVKLDKDEINVRLTTSTRVGFHEYTFSKAGQANIILDLNHRDKLLQGEVRIIDGKTIEVLRRSEAWARDQYVFARIEFSKPMTVSRVNNNGVAPAKTTDNFFAGTVLALSFSADVSAGEAIKIKVALSPTGYDGAKKNMSEIKDWDFEAVQNNVQHDWDKVLSKISITASNKDDLTIFYTALYHTMVQPNIAQDIDGKYRGRDNKIHTAKGFDYYSVFSLWDTFRAAHPLYTLIDKKRTADFINTFLAQYEQGGRLPVWELASNETDCMIGYHSVSVIADAMAKGITGFDYKKAYQAAKHSAMLDHLGLDAYKKRGFIAIDDEHESVSKTLEYAYDDWCIAQMALMLNNEKDYQYFMQRSQNWKNLFDPTARFMRPKRNGGWDKPFDPREVNNNFTEGNSWQYSFFVPQDIPGMINAYGGQALFQAKLDEMFTAPSQTTGREQVDITGLIGQYAHGNEPSHHMAYLYAYVGNKPETVRRVNYILRAFYKNSPDGLIGNEDCGQMSAWYVLSAIGLYDVTPGNDSWLSIPPYFDAKINFEDGTSVAITKDKPADERIGSKPVKTMAKFAHQSLVVVPVIKAGRKTFKGGMSVVIEPGLRDANAGAPALFYRLSDSGAFSPYSAPLHITESTRIYAFAKLNGVASDTISGSFFRRPNDFTIELKSTYNKQYHAGGPDGLLDGIHGTENWRKGDWQGYQSQDFEAVIDMQQPHDVNSLSATFLQDSRSWILMPTKVEYYLSDDNQNFRLVGSATNSLDPKSTENEIRAFGITLQKTRARYMKIKAYNFGKLPEWHQGFGGDAFIFIDEIQIE